MSRAASASENRRSRKPETSPSWVSKSDGVHGKMRSSSEKKGFVFLNFKGMGCKSISLHPSTPGIIRSAAEWEAKGTRNGSQKRKKGSSKKAAANVAVDVPDVCCAPPGIGFSSHFSTRNRNPVLPRNDRVKHSREDRRIGNGPGSGFGIESRDDHRFADEIIEIMMSQHNLLTGRSLFYDHSWNSDDHGGFWSEGSFGRREPSYLSSITRSRGSLRDLDPYHEWRLDVDDMSYEELLDLGDRIGHVGTGLQEEEIPGCLRIRWRFSDDFAAPLPANDNQRDLKCSICQEKYVKGNEVGLLGCGHHHHVDCIRQWLLKKNSCPICKCEAKQRNSG